MADTKISALTAATTPLAGTEVLPIVQSGTTKQVSVANLTAGRAVSTLSAASLGPNGIPITLQEITAAPSSATAAYVGVSTSAFPGGANGDLILIPRTSGANDVRIFVGSGTPTEAVVVQGSTKDLRIASGNLVMATSGKGITDSTGTVSYKFTSTYASFSGGYALFGTTSASTGGATMAAVLDARTVNSGFGLGVIGNASNTQIMRFAYDTTAVGSIVISSSGTTYNIISDARLKTDHGVVSETDVIANTKIHDVTYNADDKQVHVLAVMAQDAVNVNPAAVTKGTDEIDENGNLLNPWQVDYSKYIPHLIVEVQSLRRRVAELEAKG